jgi:hypothetical protein
MLRLIADRVAGVGVISIGGQVSTVEMLSRETQGSPASRSDEDGLVFIGLPAAYLRQPRRIVVENGPHAEVVEGAG